jgi:hypothetical protein
MSASISTVRGWLSEGIEKGASHVLVVLDQLTLKYFPVFIAPDQDVHEVVAQYDLQKQELKELYNLKLDLDLQLLLPLAWQY